MTILSGASVTRSWRSEIQPLSLGKDRPFDALPRPGVGRTGARRSVVFEFLVLEGAQAGLSWETILAERENFRRAFDRFDPEKVARYGSKKIEQLMVDAGIIRNRLKVTAAIDNAKALLTMRDEFGSFAEYLWEFVGGSRSSIIGATPGRCPPPRSSQTR